MICRAGIVTTGLAQGVNILLRLDKDYRLDAAGGMICHV